MKRNGFTLVELMVVIAVMAAVTGVVVLTFAGPGSGPGETATRFASRLAAARDQAVITGRPISAWATASGYGFDQLRDGHWERLSAKPFAGADWGAGTSIAFGTADEGRARIRFDSLGMPDQPFTVRLARDGRTVQVDVAMSGDVAVQ